MLPRGCRREQVISVRETPFVHKLRTNRSFLALLREVFLWRPCSGARSLARALSGVLALAPGRRRGSRGAHSRMVTISG